MTILVVSTIVVAIAFLVFWYQGNNKKIEKLKSTGVTVKAQLDKVVVAGSGTRKSANLHYSYNDSSGKSHTGRALDQHSGLKKNYELQEGDEIDIKYLADDPGFSMWVETLKEAA